eukprot:SAG11_NODE_14856_length_597_cov_1.263052_1_plen_27_part_10
MNLKYLGTGLQEILADFRTGLVFSGTY